MYGKFFSSAFSGSMFGAGANTFAVWAYVIAHAVEGSVELNPLMLAASIGMSSEQVEAAIQVLCSPDERSRSNEEQGRRLIHDGAFQYQVVNHAKYRGIRNNEERREYNRQAKRRQRARVIPSVNDKAEMSTMSAYTETETETETEAVNEQTTAVDGSGYYKAPPAQKSRKLAQTVTMAPAFCPDCGDAIKELGGGLFGCANRSGLDCAFLARVEDL